MNQHRVPAHFVLVLLAAVRLFPLLAQDLHAQTPQASGSIRGIVRSANQQPASGIAISLEPANHAVMKQTRTDANGKYEFAALPAGDYLLRLKNPGSNAEVVKSVVLHPGDEITIDLDVPSSSSSALPAFYDEPSFTVAGVSENTGAGVHGSDASNRNAAALAKAAASLPSSASTTGSAPSSDSEPPETAEHLRQLIATKDAPQLHNELGHVEENAGHSLEALKEFQTAAAMNPSEENLFDLGTELLVHRAAEPAAEVFSKGNRLYPQSVRMLTGWAVADYARGAYDAAVQRLCQASDLAPRDKTPYTFLGRMQNAEVKRSAPGLAKLARYAELYPEDPAANYYYAVALWEQSATRADDATKVEQLLRKTLALDPNFASAHVQLGTLEADRNRFSEAVSCFQRAIALDPNLEEAHYRLAQVYRRIGESSKAQAELQTYQRLVQDSTAKDKAERQNVQQFVYELKAPAPQGH